MMTKSEFCRRMKAMRKKMESLNVQRDKLFDDLFELGVDCEKLSDAENADDISQAINCYIDYNEYTPEKIWDEMKEDL